MLVPLKGAPDLGAERPSSEIILQFLRRAIIKGELADGEPIRQEEVARRFNVSKIPVREALKCLEAEGLVVFHRHRGALVASITQAELAQVYEVRVLLEVQLLKQAVPLLTEGHLARADAVLKQFLSTDDSARWAELNWAFHCVLYEAAQRPYVLNTLRTIHDKIERYLRLQVEASPNGKANADAEHRAILAACRDGDGERAGRLLEHHIWHVCEQLLDLLPRSRDPDVAPA